MNVMNIPDLGTNPDYGFVIGELHKRLQSTLMVLSQYVKTHGMIDGREDETLSTGAIVLQAAIDIGLIDVATGTVPETLAVLPVDDDTRSFSDPLVSEVMILAGTEALDKVQEDMAAYVSGKSIDWDNGMAAVAVYRAMTRAARERPYRCRLDIDDRMTGTVVREVSKEAAARAFAMQTFQDYEGEWMGGGISVISAEGSQIDDEPQYLAAQTIVFGTHYDTDIEFDPARNGEPYATAKLKPKTKTKA